MTSLTTRDRDLARAQRVLAILAEQTSPVRRVLDLASRTGFFMEQLYDAGMTVTGVEGRVENIQQTPAHLQSSVTHCDVRDLRDRVNGPFDATLCLGILYHLEAADAVRLLQDIAAVTNGVLILDTHVSAPTATTIPVNGRMYSGAPYYEGNAHDFRWAAIGNQYSWWFTSSALVSALEDAGFTDVRHLTGPAYVDEPPGREWFVARSGVVT